MIVRKRFCTLVLIVCILIWFLSPFIAVSRSDLGNQPTACETMFDERSVIGNNNEHMQYWVALGTILGLLASLACIYFDNYSAFRVSLWSNILILFIPIIEIIYKDSFEYFQDMFGFGYWTIFTLILVTLPLSSKKIND